MAANIISFVFILFLSVISLASYTSAGDFCYNWQTNLYHGLRSNSDVRFLQMALNKEELLAEDYITGNFFNLTLNSVKEFQKKYGIENTGFVGPLTRGQLNKIYNCDSATSTAPAASFLKPVVESISPSSGPAGTMVTLKGKNFTPAGNTVYAGHVILNNLPSADGKTITFKVSSPLPEGTKNFSFPLKFGFFVENVNGASNVEIFLLTF